MLKFKEMNGLNINRNFLSRITIILLLLMAVSCKKDETNKIFTNASLDAVITEAETLLTNSNEGTLPGQYKPGSKKELQEVVVWAEWKKENSKAEAELDDAANKVTIYINKFKANVVTLAIPWIHQDVGTCIKVSEKTGTSVQSLTNQSFTIEAKFYFLDLAQRGWCNELFCKVTDGKGFEVRCFGDGSFNFAVGIGSDWAQQTTAKNLVKSGEWVHVAFVNEITKQTLYVNGVEVGSQTATYVNSRNEDPFTVGNVLMWGSDRVMNGMVKDLRFWSTARSGSEISTNKDAILMGSEQNLAMFFPFNADLGTEVIDNSGNYKASFIGNVTWVPNGIPPVIEIDYSALNAAITAITTLKESITTEGTNNGDYPVGTKAYLQSLIEVGNALKTSSPKQYQVDALVTNINANLGLVNAYLVADANGIYVDREDPKSVGLRITPNYTPQGDYTVEFDVNLKTLKMDGTGEMFNNGEFGIWVYGYKEITEEAITKSGGLYNFTSSSTGWTGPKTGSLVMKPGNWQHIAIVHDNTARTTAIYVDGIQYAKQTNIGVPNVSGWGEIWLGNGWGKMNGTIKDFRLWDEVRAVGDLDATITGTEPNLKIYFPLNKVAGINFKDVTGNFSAELKGVVWQK
ncbi:MAG: LamG domain-containing protein [Bacteroidales bacterium]|nr:MAG: LamG domain-containing protein [Bacteroidales bacterium]